MNLRTTLASGCAAITLLCAAIGIAAEWGGSVGVLAMLAMFGTTILVIYRKNGPSGAWDFAALTPPAVPLALLCVVGISTVLSPDLRFSHRWQGVVNSLHTATLMTSGPLGIVATLAAENNFPYDRDWGYGLLLAGAVGIQWFGVFHIGRRRLRRAPTSQYITLIWCLAVTLSIFGVTFVVHVLLLAGKHS